jgi:hypothetical protein
VQVTTLEENRASQRVLEKVGFEREGTLHNFRIVRGDPRDCLVFSCLPAYLRGSTPSSRETAGLRTSQSPPSSFLEGRTRRSLPSTISISGA